MSMRVLLLALALWATSASAWSNQSEFDQGVQALQEEQPALATDLLEPLLLQGLHTSGVYYNLGIAHRELGKLPQARLAFERALLARPADLATRRRLREVKADLDSQVQNLEVRGTPWWTDHHLAFLALLPLFCIVLWSALARFIFQQKPEHSPKPAIVALFWWAMICGIWLVTTPAPSRGLVMLDGVSLLNDPIELRPLMPLPPGLMIELMDTDRHLWQVRLGTGETGWIRAGQIAPLYPPEPPSRI